MERKRRREEEGGDSRAVSSKSRASAVHAADKEEYSTTKSSSNITADDGVFKVPRPRQVLTVKHLREERSRLLDEHFGYSNTNNPFGDRMLAEPFVWKKKNQLLQAAGQKGKTTVAALLQSSKSKVQEIENVKRRREEREKEEELLQQQREEVQREREQEHYADYAAKEEVFHRLMHLKKTEIRLEQNRAEPIDLIVKGLRILKGEKFEKYETLPCPPHEIFQHYHDEPMNERTLEQLVSDVKLHVDVEATVVDRDFQLFWKSFLLLCTDALERARKKQEVMASLSSTNSSTPQAAAAAARLAAAVATPLRDAESGIVLAVASDVEQLLSSKTIEEIDELQQQIQKKLEQEEDIDVCYWEAIAQKIPFYKARAVCMQTWQQMVIRAAEMMREAAQQKAMEEAAAEKEKLEQTLLERGLDSAEQLENLLLEETEAKRLAKIQQIKETAFKMARAVEKTVNSNADGSYSPELEPYGEEDVPPPLRGPHSPPLWPYEEFKNCEILSQEEDDERRNTLRCLLVQKERSKRRGLDVTASGSMGPAMDDVVAGGLAAVEEEEEEEERTRKAQEAAAQQQQQQQQQLLGLSSPVAPVVPASAPGAALLLDPAAKITTYEEFVRKERKNLAPDEEVMSSSAEQRLSLHYSWEEKYRPRKPRFFNRVRTGYSWSKYNTTHYDHDNPPPKVVQGYKFNIFYPDLIDKRKTPTWFLEPSDTPDTVIIRFHAGPPYEDVAFKILNQEWQLERTRGFRNAFDRGIMQLYFSFKRYIYRR